MFGDGCLFEKIEREGGLAPVLPRKGVDATVTIAHSRTADLLEVCRQADIVIGAVGQAHLITAAHIKPGAAVIDVGISRTEAGIVGDVDFEAVQAVAGAITPMPGGTGPMTNAVMTPSQNVITWTQRSQSVDVQGSAHGIKKIR